jgi:hypothetical protein
MTKNNKHKILKKVWEEVQDVYEEIKALEGFHVSHLWKFIVIVVQNVEDLSENLTGKEKKELATIIANKLIDIPIVPEWMEERVISLLIDMIVESFNAIFGKKSWNHRN